LLFDNGLNRRIPTPNQASSHDFVDHPVTKKGLDTTADAAGEPAPEERAGDSIVFAGRDLAADP